MLSCSKGRLLSPVHQVRRRWFLSHSSMNTFFKASLVGIQFTNNRPSVSLFPFPWDCQSAGVAPLPSCFHKLLDETVKTFAVFPSWMYLLDGEDNFMLSVPFSTCDLHVSCWQSGEWLPELLCYLTT